MTIACAVTPTTNAAPIPAKPAHIVTPLTYQRPPGRTSGMIALGPYLDGGICFPAASMTNQRPVRQWLRRLRPCPRRSRWARVDERSAEVTEICRRGGRKGTPLRLPELRRVWVGRVRDPVCNGSGRGLERAYEALALHLPVACRQRRGIAHLRRRCRRLHRVKDCDASHDKDQQRQLDADERDQHAPQGPPCRRFRWFASTHRRCRPGVQVGSELEGPFDHLMAKARRERKALPAPRPAMAASPANRSQRPTEAPMSGSVLVEGRVLAT